MRRISIDFLLAKAINMATDLFVWEDLVMMHASDIAHELYVRDIVQNVRISTLEEYARWMRISTPGLCIFGNTP